MQPEEIDILMKDKTDFNKRLKLIAVLKEQKSDHSLEALQYLLNHDVVYKVRLAAWRALNERGVQCTEPVARPRYAVVLEKTIDKLKRFGVWLMDISEGFR
ncbi:hypothetical protein ACCW76_16620 [Pantoea sp. C8B4]|uniref:hypothetical protein n=1 Tax=Pantoea sp. C8B4 TaxID=3243083 RepID=UPI003EDAE541